MDREASSSLKNKHQQFPRREDTSSPPWERSVTMQVPFTNANTPAPLSITRGHTVPTLWTARSHESRRQQQHHHHHHPQLQRSQSISEDSPIDSALETWQTKKQTSPYETPVYLLPSSTGLNTAASAPPFVMEPTRLPGRPAPPLTPPDSMRSRSVDATTTTRTSTTTTTTPAPLDDNTPFPTVTAFPGTMFTRPGIRRPQYISLSDDNIKSSPSHCCCCSSSSHQHQHQHQHQHSESDDARLEQDKAGHHDAAAAAGKPRWKAALKGMFKRKPMNDSDFVRIGDQHWTDD